MPDAVQGVDDLGELRTLEFDPGGGVKVTPTGDLMRALEVLTLEMRGVRIGLEILNEMGRGDLLALAADPE